MARLSERIRKDATLKRRGDISWGIKQNDEMLLKNCVELLDTAMKIFPPVKYASGANVEKIANLNVDIDVFRGNLYKSGRKGSPYNLLDSWE